MDNTFKIKVTGKIFTYVNFIRTKSSKDQFLGGE